jgi:hypothetical protein
MTITMATAVSEAFQFLTENQLFWQAGGLPSATF